MEAREVRNLHADGIASCQVIDRGYKKITLP
jgi:hypothetical protein